MTCSQLNKFLKRVKKLKVNSKEFQKKCEKIKIVATDVDGVLTDGGRFYSQTGEIMKKFLNYQKH